MSNPVITGFLVPYVPISEWRLVKFFDSIQLSASSAWSRMIEYILGDRGKNISIIDGAAVGLSSAGMALISSSPSTGVALFALGAVPLAARRGTAAAFIAPLSVVTAIKYPALAGSIA